MESPCAQWDKWFAACGTGLCALGDVHGACPFNGVAVAFPTQAPSSRGAVSVPAYPECPAGRSLLTPACIEGDVPSCIYRILAGDTQGRFTKTSGTTPHALLRALQAAHIPGQKIGMDIHFSRAGGGLLIPNPSLAIGAPPPAESPLEEISLPDVQIATQYLSTPKHEDVILTASATRWYALVLADGATSYRVSGAEISGGGRRAAEIAVQTAMTYLTGHLLPGMGISAMLATLRACFSAANTALEKHNASTTLPGGTTLIIALLCQGGDGLWYWVYGNLGNGVLELLHSQPLLNALPIHTPLLSKQANGKTTITMPGYATQGFQPAIACKPHVPGDILVIGSDGLDHLDTVTKQCNRFDFSNYLWTQIHSERSRLAMVLHGLHNERAQTQWGNALELDDTTIGIMWA